MPQLVAYEVQCYSGGSWVIQSIFDDKELALIEARRMEVSGLRKQETRVVKEVYDQDQDKTRSSVVYESPMVRTKVPTEARQQPAAKRPPGARRQEVGATARQAQKAGEACKKRRSQHADGGPVGRWFVCRGVRRSLRPAHDGLTRAGLPA